MLEAAVVARSVTYRVGSATLVSGVDLNAVPGELTAIIGPNGAGKSTLLNLLAGNLHPSEGSVSLNGINTATSLPGQLALARSVLIQREPIDIPYTAAQVVEMGRFPHRHDPTNTRDSDVAAIQDAMRRTSTLHHESRFFRTLSGGEQTRVSLARVLAQDTPIVLLDEPTTALDAAHQEQIMRQIVELARRKRTVIVVLHDLNAAAFHADRIVLMDHGQLMADGPPHEILTEDVLTSVYGLPMVVVKHPFRPCPLVLPGDPPATFEG